MSDSHADRQEAELRAYDAPLRAAAAVGRGDQVLDIGCGSGRSTRDAARVAAPGRVLGIDTSASSLARARELSVAEGLDNVEYVQGDAQTHPFARGHYDVAVSRFGVMFFSDRVAAFANVSRALRPGGRLALVVWQSRERNEWATAIGAAVGRPLGSGPFSLGDADATAAILERAGLHGVHFEDVPAPIYFGDAIGDAFDFVRGFGDTRAALARLDPADSARRLERLRETLAAHRTAEHGVVFDSRAWIITARA